MTVMLGQETLMNWMGPSCCFYGNWERKEHYENPSTNLNEHSRKSVCNEAGKATVPAGLSHFATWQDLCSLWSKGRQKETCCLE